MDAAHRMGLQALARLSVDTELEFALEKKTKKNTGPLLAVLSAMRNDAVAALLTLPSVDAENQSEIRRLQNDVTRFVEMVAHVRGILEAGDEAFKEMGPEELVEFRAAVGLEPDGDDA